MAPIITESQIINGVLITDLKSFGDDRGRFSEIFRKEWFPERAWQLVQMNRSDSKAGVLRGLHYHFKQVDYWYLASGQARVGLADLRRDSPTFKQTQTIDIDASAGTGIFIPVGVAHGFLALTNVTLIYIVDNYYDGADELGLIWNDPDVVVNWNTDKEPILSGRDLANPRFQDIPFEQLPR